MIYSCFWGKTMYYYSHEVVKSKLEGLLNAQYQISKKR